MKKKGIITVILILLALAILPFLPDLYVKTVRELPVNKSRLRPLNIRAYKDTPAWGLSKAVFDQDTAEIRRQVIENHIPVDTKDPVYGFSLLAMASAGEKTESVKSLLKLGADANSRDSVFDVTPLILATAYHQNIEVIKILLDYGADPNADSHMTVNPFTLVDLVTQHVPLFNAINEKSLPIVKLLVEYGADINQYPDYALYGSFVNLAVACGNPDIAIYLIRQGGDYKAVFEYAGGGEGNILTLLRSTLFDLGSEKHKQKMELVSLLKERGLDYCKVPIREHILEEIKEKYPDSWEEYIRKY